MKKFIVSSIVASVLASVVLTGCQNKNDDPFKNVPVYTLPPNAQPGSPQREDIDGEITPIFTGKITQIDGNFITVESTIVVRSRDGQENNEVRKFDVSSIENKGELKVGMIVHVGHEKESDKAQSVTIVKDGN